MDQPESKTVSPIRWRSKYGSYDVTLRFALIEGRWECVGADVRPVGRQPQVLTAAALHALPLGKLADKRRKEAGDVTISVVPGRLIFSGSTVHTHISKRRGRPPKYDRRHWEDVAKTYREAYVKNRTPTRAVARRWDVTESTAAKWVAKCRSLGLLPPTRRGKARAVVDAPRASGRIRIRATAKGQVVATRQSKGTRRGR